MATLFSKQKKQTSNVKPPRTVTASLSVKGSRQLTEEQIKQTLDLAALAQKQADASVTRRNLMVGKKVGGYDTIAKRVKVVGSKERITVNPNLYDIDTLKRKEF